MKANCRKSKHIWWAATFRQNMREIHTYVDEDGATEIKFKESKEEANDEAADGVETECLTWRDENESPIVGNANTSGGLLLSVETWEKYVDEDGTTEIKFR